MDDSSTGVKQEKASARSKQLSTRALIDSSFPTIGTEQKSTQGSQSTAPTKEYP